MKYTDLIDNQLHNIILEQDKKGHKLVLDWTSFNQDNYTIEVVDTNYLTDWSHHNGIKVNWTGDYHGKAIKFCTYFFLDFIAYLTLNKETFRDVIKKFPVGKITVYPGLLPDNEQEYYFPFVSMYVNYLDAHNLKLKDKNKTHY